MSGGIDSSATCIMLQEQGYEVVGVTMRTYLQNSPLPDRQNPMMCSKPGHWQEN